MPLSLRRLVAVSAMTLTRCAAFEQEKRGRATPEIYLGTPPQPGVGECARPILYDERTGAGLPRHLSQFE